MRFLVLVILVLATVGPVMAGAGFSDHVRAHFGQWDLNHDGTLTADELSRIMTDPTIQGEDAALRGSRPARCRSHPVENSRFDR